MTQAVTNPSTVGTVTCDALRLLPDHIITRISGQQVLAQISDDWFCLVGPDDDGGAIEATAGLLPGGASGWTASFESFGDALLTHFER